MKKSREKDYEFGGPTGAIALMIFSHSIVLYLYWCIHCFGGDLQNPFRENFVADFLKLFDAEEPLNVVPTVEAACIYWGFLTVQGVFAIVLPGVVVKGLPIREEGGKQLSYLCNAASAWWLTLGILSALHFSGIWPLHRVIDLLGPLTTVAMVSSDLISVLTFIMSYVNDKVCRPSGNLLYDFFMGTYLNPRLFSLDLKMWAEVRVSWMILWILAASAAAKQYDVYGTVSWPMIFILTAQGLYTNACMKGEECIPTTWDIFYEKWGWMLTYWNLCGVPFVYCSQSMYLMQYSPFEHHPWYQVSLFVVLFVAYYIWDTSQSQRNRFRMKRQNTFVERSAPPQLPWGTLPDGTEFMHTAAGSQLLLDGWWRYARKIHYTTDIVMAALWGLSCGFNHWIPYFYFFFFFGMIMHRAHRDIAKCQNKYGKDWERYTEIVPWIFIPHLI